MYEERLLDLVFDLLYMSFTFYILLNVRFCRVWFRNTWRNPKHSKYIITMSLYDFKKHLYNVLYQYVI